MCHGIVKDQRSRRARRGVVVFLCFVFWINSRDFLRGLINGEMGFSYINTLLQLCDMYDMGKLVNVDKTPRICYF